MYSMYTTTNSDTMICSGSNVSSIDRWLSVVPPRFHRELADIPFDMQTQWPWDITGRPAPGEKGQRYPDNIFLLKMDPDAVNNWNGLKSVKNRRIFGENRVTLISTLIVAPKKKRPPFFHLLKKINKQLAGGDTNDAQQPEIADFFASFLGGTGYPWHHPRLGIPPFRLNQRRVMVAPSSVRVSQKKGRKAWKHHRLKFLWTTNLILKCQQAVCL